MASSLLSETWGLILSRHTGKHHGRHSEAVFRGSPKSLLKPCVRSDAELELFSSFFLAPCILWTVLGQSHFSPFSLPSSECLRMTLLSGDVFRSRRQPPSVRNLEVHSMLCSQSYLKSWQQAIWGVSHQTRVRFQKDSLMEQETNRDGQLREEQMRRGIEGRKDGQRTSCASSCPWQSQFFLPTSVDSYEKYCLDS